jgi:hypothetical protein
MGDDDSTTTTPRPPWRIELVDDLGGLPIHRTRDRDGQLVLQLSRGVMLDESTATVLSDFFPDVFEQYDTGWKPPVPPC